MENSERTKFISGTQLKDRTSLVDFQDFDQRESSIDIPQRRWRGDGLLADQYSTPADYNYYQCNQNFLEAKSFISDDFQDDCAQIYYRGAKRVKIDQQESRDLNRQRFGDRETMSLSV